jgi:tetratricopeptide (TPR) repeat protein
MGLSRVRSTSIKTFPALFLALVAMLLGGGCSKTAPTRTSQPANANATAAAASNTSADATANAAQLDAEVERLEKQAQRNPSDDEVREALSQAFVRRGNARRAAQQLREALSDYENALRANPDNEEAQRSAAEISPQVEGEATGEYGEPAPLPITPNVTAGGDETAPAKEPTPAKKKTDKQ